jgi:transposase
MDAEGIPLTYDLYPGNTNDCETLLPILKKAKERYNLKRTIVVADRGLCTSDNIAANILDNNGYVFSQSVQKSDRALKEWVLDQSGYRGDDEFRIKSCQADKTVYVTDDNGRQIKVDVPIKRIAFWSADYAARSKHERGAVLEKSARLTSDTAAFEHARSYGAGRYIKERTIDSDTGEIKKTIREIDEAKIAQDEKFDGYYCIITSETDLADEKIIEIYRGLWRIEETFRVTKSDLCARPVFVSLENHIEAHFLTCYMALVLLRLIQADTGFEYSAAKIAEAIGGIIGTHMKESCYLFSYRTELTDKLGDLIGQELDRQIYTVKAMKNILAETKKVGT